MRRLIEDPNGEHPRIGLNAVPEPKVVKNRLHLDVDCASQAEYDGLLARGATVVAELPHWTVMRDPEGNEFCAFRTDR